MPVHHFRTGFIGAALGALLIPFAAHAQSVDDSDSGLGDDAMPGVIRLDSAHAIPSGMALSLTSGYGYTGADLKQGDRHQRAAGRMVFAYGITSDFAAALRLDGRYDKHSGTAGKDDGWVGDPRLSARYRRSLADSLAVAVQLGLWAPSSKVPSIDFDALSVEAVTSWTYGEVNAPLQVSLNAGYRLDRSAASVTEAQRLSLADRLSLGLSDFNAALLGLGASYKLGAVEALAEVSVDYLHGKDAPSFRHSPMRVGVGARYPISDTIDIFANGQVRLNKVDAMALETSLIPFEPQLQMLAGIQLRFGGDAPPVVETLVVDDTPKKEPEPVAPPTAAFSGVVKSGDTLIANATLTIRDKDGNERTATTSVDGTFVIDDMLVGALTVTIKAEGYELGTQQLDLAEGGVKIDVTLEAVLPPGQLRGVVRSFRGKPLEAELTIMPANTTLTTAADGSFELDLPPGDYDVTVTVEGFKEQTRQIRIEEDGVTIMNVDLRK